MPPLRSTGTGPEAEDPEYAGQYLLEARLGSGGMGVVHLARSASGLRLAVKVVHAEFAEDDEFRARFRQEVAAARRVSGAFTASVVDADPDAARPWMATLYIPGPTLSQHVKRNGPLAPAEVRRLAAGLAEALRDIHRVSVVHRDLKPGNVLLANDGPKVIDFGISRPSDSDLHTETGKLIGTPPFMAPEQFQSPRSVGPAADVFALGSVLVHAATGRGPFDSDSPYLVAYHVVHEEADLTGVPGDLMPLIRACLAKEPEHRPTPDALMEMLRSAAPLAGHAASGPAVRLPGQRRSSAIEEADVRARHGGPHDGGDTGPFDDWGASSGERGRLADPVPGRVLDLTADPGATPAAVASTHVSRRRVRARQGRRAAGPGAQGGRWGGTFGVRGRNARLMAAGTVAVVVCGAGAALAVRQAGDEHSVPPPRHVAASFRPWHTTLSEADPDGGYAPFCTYAEGALYCSAHGVKAARLNPADGRELWSRADTSSPTDAASIAAPPVLCGGLLHVTSPDGRRLEALDTRSGATRWSVSVSAYGGRVYHAGNSVLLVGRDGTVRALDGATGTRRWEHSFRGPGVPIFTTYGKGRIAYATTPTGDGSRTVVDAVDAATGKVRWHRSLTGDLAPAGVGRGGDLLLTSTDRELRTDAVIRYNPSGRRERRIPLASPAASTNAVVEGDTIHLLAYGGALLSIDTGETGAGEDPSEQRRVETSVSNASPPLAAGEHLYFTAGDGRLVSVDTDRGALKSLTQPRTRAGSQGYTASLPAPVLAADAIFAGAPDGTVFAVRAPAS